MIDWACSDRSSINGCLVPRLKRRTSFLLESQSCRNTDVPQDPTGHCESLGPTTQWTSTVRRFRHSHPLGWTSINAAGQEAPDISDIPDSSQKGTENTKCCDPVLRRFTANWRDSRNATPYFAAVAACVQVALSPHVSSWLWSNCYPFPNQLSTKQPVCGAMDDLFRCQGDLQLIAK